MACVPAPHPTGYRAGHRAGNILRPTLRSGHKHRSTSEGVVGLGVVEFYGRSRSDFCGSRSFMLPSRRFYGTLHAKITKPQHITEGFIDHYQTHKILSIRINTTI